MEKISCAVCMFKFEGANQQLLPRRAAGCAEAAHPLPVAGEPGGVQREEGRGLLQPAWPKVRGRRIRVWVCAAGVAAHTRNQKQAQPRACLLHSRGESASRAVAADRCCGRLGRLQRALARALGGSCQEKDTHKQAGEA